MKFQPDETQAGSGVFVLSLNRLKLIDEVEYMDEIVKKIKDTNINTLFYFSTV